MFSVMSNLLTNVFNFLGKISITIGILLGIILTGIFLLPSLKDRFFNSAVEKFFGEEYELDEENNNTKCQDASLVASNMAKIYKGIIHGEDITQNLISI